ncbi:MAG: hypothetical protein ABSG89_03420 [Bacteroidales bacterium]|jgi:hypothetical protein
MKKWLILPVLLFIFGCSGKQPDSYFTYTKALLYFNKAKEICDRDNGKLWGKNLYGPLMFVDRNNRRIIANSPDNENLLKEKDGVYTGFYPKERIISYSWVTFGGKLYGMAPLPPEEDEYRIIYRAIRGLFHLFQQTTGFTSSDYLTSNMDEKNARLWLKLEWKALRRAIDSRGDEQLLAIRDALIFKGANHECFPKYSADETRFENYEGLATFTSILLSTNSPEEFKKRLFESLDRFYFMESYSRSYGIIHGALYATLLYMKGFDFTSIHSENVDLCELVKNIYNIKLPSICRDVAGSLMLNYDFQTILSEEAKRESDMMDRIHTMTSIFTEKPVIILELESPYFDFEPEDVHSMDTIGTIYSKMRVSDNWGKLSVESGGCLVSNNYKFLRITAKGLKSDKNRIEGDGWLLMINNNWKLVPVNQNFCIKKMGEWH